MASTRRLAAILAADVAGYSRLMCADEEGTLERLKAHRRQLIDPKISEHRGRIVKTTGDGLLAEFSSVVDAVRCAAEVQRGMLDREPDQSQIANMLAVRAGNGWSASPAADLERAEKLVGQALAEAPRDWLAHYAKGAVLRRRPGKCEDAIPEFETALALNPNWLNSLNLLAWCKIMTGSIAEAIPLDPPEPRRSRPLRLLYQHGNCALAAVATRRGNCLVREGARPPSRFRLQLSRCDIRAQR